MVFEKLTEFGYFSLDAILTNIPDHAPPCHTHFSAPIHRTVARGGVGQCKHCTTDMNI